MIEETGIEAQKSRADLYPSNRYPSSLEGALSNYNYYTALKEKKKQELKEIQQKEMEAFFVYDNRLKNLNDDK